MGCRPEDTPRLPRRAGQGLAVPAMYRDHHLGRPDAAAIRRECEAARLARDLRDARIGDEPDVLTAARREQSFVVECRVQVAGAAHGHAAVVEVAGNLLALPAARHHGRAGIRVPVERLRPAGKAIVVFGAVGAHKAAPPPFPPLRPERLNKVTEILWKLGR
jgi:hypothetical protein